MIEVNLVKEGKFNDKINPIYRKNHWLLTFISCKEGNFNDLSKSHV